MCKTKTEHDVQGEEKLGFIPVGRFEKWGLSSNVRVFIHKKSHPRDKEEDAIIKGYVQCGDELWLTREDKGLMNCIVVAAHMGTHADGVILYENLHIQPYHMGESLSALNEDGTIFIRDCVSLTQEDVPLVDLKPEVEESLASVEYKQGGITISNPEVISILKELIRLHMIAGYNFESSLKLAKDFIKVPREDWVKHNAFLLLPSQIKKYEAEAKAERERNEDQDRHKVKS